MKIRTSVIMLAALLVVSFGLAVAQDVEMNKEQWQQEINNFTKQRDSLSAYMKSLDTQLANMKGQSTQLEAEYKKAQEDLYALVGADPAKVAEYRSQVEAAERKADELMRLSDADLLARQSEVTDLETTVKGLWGNKISLIPEFWDRNTALNEKVKSLNATLANQVKTYTVGTWSKDRDCLWNIAKKKDIYDNAWLWPKIWQGNRDQIKDPDVIHTGQKLMIPKGNELTSDEKSAAKKYYAKKAQVMAPAAPAAK
jgi:hypothetical protein